MARTWGDTESKLLHRLAVLAGGELSNPSTAHAMEFPFDLAACIGAPTDHKGPCVGYIDERILHGRAGGMLSSVLEEIGQRSASAQGLRKPVTFGCRHGLGEQRVYLLVDGRKALGFLKVGQKRLFVASALGDGFADVKDAFREIEPLCALDFYVHERFQRFGHGRRLFDTMLAREQIEPARLGYDRPSPKLMAFLKRHYGLNKYMPQSNNFVVFDAYFDPSAQEDAENRSITGNEVHGRQTGQAQGIERASQRSARPPPEPPMSSPAHAAGQRRRAPGGDLFDRGYARQLNTERSGRGMERGSPDRAGGFPAMSRHGTAASSLF